MRAAVFFIAYQAAWWGTALLAREGHGGPAALAMIAYVLVALAFDARRRERAKLVAQSGLVGVCVDGSLRALDVVVFAPNVDAAPAPAFMIALWLGFGCVLPIPWVSRRPLVGVLLGGLGGALAYRGGAALGVLTIEHGALGLAAVGIAWAIAFPLLGAASVRLRLDEGSAPR